MKCLNLSPLYAILENELYESLTFRVKLSKDLWREMLNEMFELERELIRNNE